jgi:ketosteroid isomerase-like protein
MWRVAVVVVACAVPCCKGASEPPTTTPASPVAGSAAGSTTVASAGSSVSTNGSASVDAARRPPAKLVPPNLQLEDVGPEPFYQVEAIAFDNKRPRLPALSADGQLVAEYEVLTSGGMPVVPVPLVLSLTAIGSAAPRELLAILDTKEAAKLWDLQSGSAWLTPELSKRLKQRGAAAMQRLKTFHTLSPLQIDESGQPIVVDNLVLEPRGDEYGNTLVVELRDAGGDVLHRTRVESYMAGGEATRCNYSPQLRAAYRDAATRMLYVRVVYHYGRDDCDFPTELPLLAWSEDPADASPEDAIAAIVERQFDVLGTRATDRTRLAVVRAPVVSPGAIGSFDHVDVPGVARDKDTPVYSVRDTTVTIAHDGTSAWASTTVSLRGAGDSDAVALRASDVLVRTKDGWRLAAMAWTVPIPDAQADRDARAGKRKVAQLAGPPGDDDASLRDAFAKLTTDGVDAAAAARKDLVVIGTAPDERTLGGAVFANGWNAAWKGKLEIASSVARVLPSGTTGWVAATLELAKSGFKVPVTIFAVFDKTADGHWSLVHIHFAV